MAEDEMTVATSFTPFMRLPPELRRMVYTAYFEGIKEDVFSIGTFASDRGGHVVKCTRLTRHVPAFALACKEGHAEVKQMQADSDRPRALRIRVLALNHRFARLIGAPLLSNMRPISSCTVDFRKLGRSAYITLPELADGLEDLILHLPLVERLDIAVNEGLRPYPAVLRANVCYGMAKRYDYVRWGRIYVPTSLERPPLVHLRIGDDVTECKP